MVVDNKVIGGKNYIRPDIWLGKIVNAESWFAVADSLLFDTYRQYPDRLPRTGYTINAYCSVCERVQPMTVDFPWARKLPGQEFEIPWGESVLCPGCNMLSRMRGVHTFIRDAIGFKPETRIYIGEQVTPSFKNYKRYFPNIIGSEFVDPLAEPGSVHDVNGQSIRHEDITNLSFPDNSLDLVVTQHIFEHVPECGKAFREIARVLVPGGSLVFDIPFYYLSRATVQRARVAANGVVEHLLPAQYHGDPLDPKNGILCYAEIGWDVLDVLRGAGFSDVGAYPYWGPIDGHFNRFCFVFHAIR